MTRTIRTGNNRAVYEGDAARRTDSREERYDRDHAADEDVEAALRRSRTSRHQALDNCDFGKIIIPICCRKKYFTQQMLHSFL